MQFTLYCANRNSVNIVEFPPLTLTLDCARLFYLFTQLTFCFLGEMRKLPISTKCVCFYEELRDPSNSVSKVQYSSPARHHFINVLIYPPTVFITAVP